MNGTAIKEGNQLSDKERVQELCGNHIMALQEDLQKAQAKFGAAVLEGETAGIKEFGNKCTKIQGQIEGIELAQRLIDFEIR
jgi:hypothetical protein